MSPANLVIRPEKLGDLVISTPVFRAFKESYPNQPLHLLTDEVFADVVRHDPHLDKIIAIKWKGRKRHQHESWSSIYHKLSPYQYERAAIFYYRVEQWNWLAAALRIPHVAQLGGTVSSFLFGHRRILRQWYQEKIHFSTWYLRVAKELGAQGSSALPRLYLTEAEIAAFEERFPFVKTPRPRVFIHPFGYGSSPNVSEEGYARLASRIVKELGVEVFISGSAGDAKNSKTEWPPEVRRDWLGTLSMREWMVAVTRASLFVSGSTGVAHVAAALQAPMLGIYCPRNGCHPDIWGALGPNVRILMSPPALCKGVQPCDSPCTWKEGCDLGAVLTDEVIFQKAREVLAEFSRF